MIRRLSCFAFFALVILLMTGSPLPGVIISGFSLLRLIQDADVIVIGRITATSSNPTTIGIDGHSYSATEHSGNILVDRALKEDSFGDMDAIPLHSFTSRKHACRARHAVPLRQDVCVNAGEDCRNGFAGASACDARGKFLARGNTHPV